MKPRAWHACAAYTAVALAATWPLAGGLGRDVAWDLGDPVMVMWALAWNWARIGAILRGHFDQVSTYFDANIFYPAPHTLAYSEHFFAQAVQIFPLYVLTENPILCYNVLFLSTFVLSGVGMFLLVRELTGNAVAGFVAGLLFAFAPFRFQQLSHLQVLSSQWMPFALYGFVRFFNTRRAWPLVGASVALVVQNLSSGYYLLYFLPFAAAFVVWEIASRRLWRDIVMWLQLAASAMIVVALTAPWLLPYAAARSEQQLARGSGEVLRYSADVYSYATAFMGQPFWGQIAQAFPKPEAFLFPGLVTVLLAIIGLAGRSAPADQGTSQVTVSTENRPWQRALAAVLLMLLGLHLIALVMALLYRRVLIDFGAFTVSISDLNQLLTRLAILAAALLAISKPARVRTFAFLRSRGFFLVALLLAAWLSLGPSPQALGRPLNLFGPYGLLYEHVPGFDGLRVPARLGMIVTLMLAILAGFGAHLISRLRAGRILLAVASVAFLAESVVDPFVVNGASPPDGFNQPEPRLYRPARAPGVYKALAGEPDGAVTAELPLGDPDFDLRAMFYSIVHGQRLMNGYSGFFPPHYGPLRAALADVPLHPEVAREALRAGRVTHLVIHESAYPGDEGALTSAAFRDLGAVELYRDGGDVLLKLP